MDNTSVFEANQRFATERKEIVADYNSHVADLKAELSIKVRKLQKEKDRKLLDVSKRQDTFMEQYRKWKQEQYEKQRMNEQLNNE